MNPTEMFIEEVLHAVEKYEATTGIIVKQITLDRYDTGSVMGEGFRSQHQVNNVKLGIE